jgi:hypothetical protein
MDLARVITGPGVNYGTYHKTTGELLFKGYPYGVLPHCWENRNGSGAWQLAVERLVCFRSIQPRPKPAILGIRLFRESRIWLAGCSTSSEMYLSWPSLESTKLIQSWSPTH